MDEFLLSMNTTLCFGMALLIFICMRKQTNVIKEETLDDISDKILPYLPKKLVDAIPQEYDIEALQIL